MEILNVMISGSRSIKALPEEAIMRINTIIGLGADIVIGDAPGVDKLVQNYLLQKEYRQVTVYHAFDKPRYNAGFNSRGGFASYTDRDKAMCAEADHGLAIWDGNSRGTKQNIARVPSTRVVRVRLAA